eukprot:22873_1
MASVTNDNIDEADYGGLSEEDSEIPSTTTTTTTTSISSNPLPKPIPIQPPLTTNANTNTNTNTSTSTNTTTISTNPNQQILSTMRWGLVPSFSQDGKSHFRTINARQDTIKSKPMYRRLINRKRCVVLFNGYYEWQTIKNTKNKQPYYFTAQYKQNNNTPLMYMAALWDVWRPSNAEGDPNKYLFTVTIITTNANKDVEFCHHRMPLLMDKNCVKQWLDVDKYTIDQCFELINKSQINININNHAVPREMVGNTKNKSIQCIQTLNEYNAKKRQKGLHKFFKIAKPKDNKDNINDEKKEMKVEDSDNELQKAIEASKVSYKMEEKKRKKRTLNDMEELDELDELKISKDKKENEECPKKKRKLNDGNVKKMDEIDLKRKIRRH